MPGRGRDRWRQGVALVAAVAADRLEMSGPDAARFLHNLTTADVRGLAAGASARGFVTTQQGRTLADFDVLATGSGLTLRLPPGRAAAIAEHLGRYRVMERVELEPGSPAGLVELRGARVPELLAQLGMVAPEAPGGHAETALAGVQLRIRRALRGREPRYELWIADDAERGEATARIRAAGAALGLTEPGAAALEAARIEDGELLWGIDYGEDAFPQETGEEGAISWTKGCYLGQEVVARIRYRGQAQRSARGLRFLDRRLPEPGTPLLVDGREVGRATSVASSETFGPIGLAIVHRRAGDPPARVELEGDGTAELAPLPFA